MRWSIKSQNVGAALASLNGARAKVKLEWGRRAQAVGVDAVSYIVREFRSGPTSKTQTQVRNNQLRRAYRARTKVERDVVTDVGLLRPEASAEVLRHGRLQEGINEDGSRFTRKVIRAKSEQYLHFPIYDPNTPGVARTNIIAWVRVKQVIFRPRPSFPAAIRKFEPRLRREATEVLRHALRAA